MAEPAQKTNAMRFLDGRKVDYDLHTYDPEIHSATEVAETLGLQPDQVYKTLVVLRERGRPLLVMVAGDAEIDLRLLAKAVGEKSVRMASQKDAERLTGLQVGGIGALALIDKPFDVCIDRAVQGRDRILVNGGRRGINLGLAVADLVALTGARLVAAVGGGAAAG